MFHRETLLEETVAFLKENLSNVFLPDVSIRVMVDEQVPPNAGEEFISVRPAEVESTEEPFVLSKAIEHGLTVTVVKRIQGAANEHVGEHVMLDKYLNRLKPSLEARADEIANLIDNNWDLINRVNMSIDGCFLSPLGFVSASIPEKRYADDYDVPEDPMNLRYVGLSLDLEFRGATYYINR